jgi:hypothetical protein
MSQKLTLSVYLKRRGEVKSLTRIEAEAFGVPYPLISGWPTRFGEQEITARMLQDLMSRIVNAKKSTANKARKALDGVSGWQTSWSSDGPETSAPALCNLNSAGQVSAFPGFIRRPARRLSMKRAN